MNKKNLLLIALIAVSVSNTIVPNIVDVQQQESVIPQDKPQWADLYKSYATSLVSGGLIGSVTGGLSLCAARTACKIFQNSDPKLDSRGAVLITFISILCAEYKLRNRLIDEANESFKDCSIKHKKNLTSDSAWIASWIAFFALEPLLKKYGC